MGIAELCSGNDLAPHVADFCNDVFSPDFSRIQEPQNPNTLNPYGIDTDAVGAGLGLALAVTTLFVLANRGLFRLKHRRRI